METPNPTPTPCRSCGGPTIGWGKDGHGNVRRFCKKCKKSFGLIPERPLGAMRLPIEKANMVLSLLIEGVSIRSAERISSVHRDTICKLLRVAGGKCDRLMNTLVRGLKVQDVELDEIWGFVAKKAATKVRQRDFSLETGDAWSWLAMEASSKLILTHHTHTGQRTSDDANTFMARVAAATTGEFQTSTDSLPAYPAAVEKHLGGRVDYGQVKKIFAAGVDGEHRYSPPAIISTEKTVIFGSPDPHRICTSHIERQNLDVRMRSRRFTRLTNAFSKTLANHKAAVSLWVAAQNFVHINRTIKMTPAMAAGIARKPWTVGMLLTA